jgi:hypothetical protein
MENRITWILLGGTILTGLVLVIVLAFIDKPLDHTTQNKQRFDRAIWMSYAGSEDRDNLRGTMANDVLERLTRRRPNTTEVVNMLGKPDSQTDQSVFIYRLGMWSNNRQTRDVMEIYFENDRVADIQFTPE